MKFQHTDEIWARFPALAPAVFMVDAVRPDADIDPALEALVDRARHRLADLPESEWPQIQAWRRGFGTMGLKPTQYRCAAEALLRRLRKGGELPRLHPLVDLCNAVSMAWGIPVAVLDLDRIDGDLTVRPAVGTEQHLEFSGAIENPDPGEVVFADEAGRTHARRWCHRQSAQSVIRPETRRALVVVEALHADAAADVLAAAGEIAAALTAGGMGCSPVRLLRRDDPVFDGASPM